MLGIRKRREAGVTVANIRKIVKELKDEGKLEGESNAAIATMVLEEILSENPDLSSDPSLDWDGLIEFIERLLPLILKVIDLFS